MHTYKNKCYVDFCTEVHWHISTGLCPLTAWNEKKITETNNQNKTETEKIILKTKHNRNKNKLNKNPWFKHGCSSTNFALLSWRLKTVSCLIRRHLPATLSHLLRKKWVQGSWCLEDVPVVFFFFFKNAVLRLQKTKVTDKALSIADIVIAWKAHETNIIVGSIYYHSKTPLCKDD